MKMVLSLSVQYNVNSLNLPKRSDFRRWVKAALAKNAVVAQITVRLVDAEEGRELNRTYRDKDYATNVLTFRLDDDLPNQVEMPLWGDIVLCVPVVAKEAEAHGKPLFAHYAHLVTHGVLHLQGYDHDTESDAAEMESLEVEILQRQGFADPYLFF